MAMLECQTHIPCICLTGGSSHCFCCVLQREAALKAQREKSQRQEVRMREQGMDESTPGIVSMGPKLTEHSWLGAVDAVND